MPGIDARQPGKVLGMSHGEPNASEKEDRRAMERSGVAQNAVLKLGEKLRMLSRNCRTGREIGAALCTMWKRREGKPSSRDISRNVPPVSSFCTMKRPMKERALYCGRNCLMISELKSSFFMLPWSAVR